MSLDRKTLISAHPCTRHYINLCTDRFLNLSFQKLLWHNVALSKNLKKRKENMPNQLIACDVWKARCSSMLRQLEFLRDWRRGSSWATYWTSVQWGPQHEIMSQNKESEEGGREEEIERRRKKTKNSIFYVD